MALNVDSWPDRIVRRAEREQRVQVTQWGRWGLVTPYVTYIGEHIWRESKLLLLTSIWFYSFAGLSLSLQFRAFRTGLTQSISLKVIQILPASLSGRTKPEYYIVPESHIFDSKIYKMR